MILSISPQANTKKVSDLLFDFAEKYSQDAFILETDSEYEQDVFNGNREIPLTEFDENNLMHYPQIIYTFDEPITDEQVADLSVALENEGIDAFNINNNEIKVSVIKFFEDTDQQNLTEDEQYEERTRDLDSKSIAAEKQRLMYSDLMSKLNQRLESKNLLIKEQPMKEVPTQQDNSIGVTFLKRSKSQPQK